MRRMIDPRGGITSLSFSRDSQLLASTTADRRGVYIWDVGTGEIVRVLEWPDEYARREGTAGQVATRKPVSVAAFAPGADYLAVANPSSVIVWETQTWAVVTRTPSYSCEYRVGELAWDPGPTHAFATSGWYEVEDTESDEDENAYLTAGARLLPRTEVWSLPSTPTPGSRLSSITTWAGESSGGIAFSNDGYFLGINGLGTVEVWNAWAGVRFWGVDFAFVGGRGPICFAPCSNNLTFARDRRILSWAPGLSRDEGVVGFFGHSDAVHALRYIPDGRTLISASADGTVRLWEASTGLETRCFDMRVGKIAAADVSPDGAVAAVGGANGEIVVWDLE